MYDNFDDFDCQLMPEDIMDDNPIDSDFEPYGFDEQEWDEGSDRDNWEDEQVFQDREWE